MGGIILCVYTHPVYYKAYLLCVVYGVQYHACLSSTESIYGKESPLVAGGAVGDKAGGWSHL